MKAPALQVRKGAARVPATPIPALIVPEIPSGAKVADRPPARGKTAPAVPLQAKGRPDVTPRRAPAAGKRIITNPPRAQADLQRAPVLQMGCNPRQALLLPQACLLLQAHMAPGALQR